MPVKTMARPSFVSRGDDLRVPLRPARLNHRGGAGGGGGQEPVRKGKEGVGRHHATFRS